MKLKEFNELIQYEEKCEEYLRSVGILKTFSNCIGCGSASPGMIRGDRYRCYSCKKEWSRRKDSILSLTRFSYSEFLICLKFFEIEFTAEATSSEFELNYKTVKMLFNLFRMRIAGMDDNLLDRYSKIIKGDTETIGIAYEDGKVKFDVPHKANEEAIIKATRHRLQKSAAHYEISYNRLKNELKLGKGEGYFSELDRFWRFAAERLFKYRGIDQKYFILYLKEIEFRYNYKGDNLFDEIVSKLA